MLENAFTTFSTFNYPRLATALHSDPMVSGLPKLIFVPFSLCRAIWSGIAWLYGLGDRSLEADLQFFQQGLVRRVQFRLYPIDDPAGVLGVVVDEQPADHI